ncbi:MAG: TIGR04255 family protein [Sphingomonadaceae bacterium]|nr:TIGR04255 family protein [Sphingomonadaceae bacterium]
MSRPADLPDYHEPPLNELVLGVQFDPIPGYSTVDAGAIWSLFRSEFPVVQEQPPLAPQFETFGGGPSPGVHIQFGPMIGHMRLWFVTEQGDHLLQFQPDRLLLNWRQNGEGTYPRYEQIAKAFQESLSKLCNHVQAEMGYELDINQIEITYINIIPVEDTSEQSKWLTIFPAFGFPIEAMSANFSEISQSEDGKSIGRLHHELRSAVSIDGRNKALQLNLTYRGKPTLPGIDGALELLGKGRLAIVKRFTELTTNEAHNAWKRTK